MYTSQIILHESHTLRILSLLGKAESWTACQKKCIHCLIFIITVRENDRLNLELRFSVYSLYIHELYSVILCFKGNSGIDVE